MASANTTVASSLTNADAEQLLKLMQEALNTARAATATVYRARRPEDTAGVYDEADAAWSAVCSAVFELVTFDAGS